MVEAPEKMPTPALWPLPLRGEHGGREEAVFASTSFTVITIGTGLDAGTINRWQ